MSSVLRWSPFHDCTKGTSGEDFWQEEKIDPLVSNSDGAETSFYDLNSTRTYIPQLSLRKETLRRLQWSNFLLLRAGFKEKLQILSAREDNWDGKESKKPSPNALNRAYTTLDEFLVAIIDAGRVWRTPFLSSDEEGHITVEWKNGKHELHIEISENSEEYIKVWGTNIEHEMHVGFLKHSGYVTLWDWLN
jgi:hypothetical protein